MRTKTGGRKKGTPNRTTKELKSVIHKVVEEHLETIESDLQALEPKDRLNVILKLVDYVLPKPKEQKIDFTSLTDTEIDELIDKITDAANRQN